MKLGKVVAYQLPVVLWAASIFALSGIQNVPVVKTPIGLDKVAHAVLFFVFCGLAWRAFFHQQALPGFRKRALALALLLSVAYGAVDEFHQAFVPSRTPDAWDLLADGVGALAYVAWHRFRLRNVVQEGEERGPEV